MPTDRTPRWGSPDVNVVSWSESLRVWVRVAAQSFGGPAGQIAVMHRILVEEKRWISEGRFVHALNYCMLLPGPEAQQLAIYIGWLLHGTKGGIVAGSLFVLPGFVSILGLSLLYVGFQETTLLAGLFWGLKPAVMVIVAGAVFRLGRRSLKNPVLVALAALAFIALFMFNAPFPWVILVAGLLGLAGGFRFPEFFPAPGHAASDGTVEDPAEQPNSRPARARPSWGQALRVLRLWGTLWAVPVFLLWYWRGADDVLVRQGLFFSQTAVVTFGGAYAVLTYIAQRAVETYHWLSPREMLDGLGLAETTPGPLIQVVQFVAFLGAFRHPGELNPWLAGILGSLITTWVTYVPCFLWIFLGAPYIEILRRQRALSSALAAISAAVVGVILNLALWFALHTLFGRVEAEQQSALTLPLPTWSTFEPGAAVLAVLAAVALLRFKVGMLPVLAGAAVAGMLLTLAAKV